MKKLLLFVAVLPLVALSATSTPAGFTDNLDEAIASAKSNGKYVFACFSGSDWCGWCKKLEREVLSKPKFLGGVTNDFELVYIDMPHDLDLLSERAKVENEKLVEKYRVQGFPTALILDGEGEVITRTGYRKGGAKKYVEHLMEIRAKGPQIRLAEQLFEEQIAPFENKVRQIVFVGMFEKVEKQVENLPQDKRDEKAKELLRQLLPESIAKIEEALSEFKAKEVPELIAKDKTEAVEQAEKLLSQMKQQLEKDAAGNK